MGNVLQFNKKLDCDKLPSEIKDVLGKYRLETMRKAEEMKKIPRSSPERKK